jgi:glycosyltransferase involved in cell wall biosynthesis
MRILLITHFFPPEHNAGTENYTLGLAKEFQSRGHDVKVICSEGWTTGEDYWNGVRTEIYKGIPVYRIHLNWTKARNPNRVLYDSLSVERWLDAFLHRENPDIVHVTSTYSLGVGVLRSVRRAGIPLVLTLMDFWFLCPRTVLLRGDGDLCDGRTTAGECRDCLLASSNLYNRLNYFLPSQFQATFWKAISQTPALARIRGARGLALNMENRKALMKQILEVPDVILSHSRFVQHMFTQANLSQRIVYLPNGHELSWTAIYRGKRKSSLMRIGYMGQISPIKGVHILVEAFEKAKLDGSARLDIWGNLEKDRFYTRSLREIIGTTELISLRGQFKREQLADVLAEIDILVVPSLWHENAPLVIYEAFATKTPVIATNLGGMSEAVTHELNGLLFDRGDVDSLSRQLRRIASDPDLLEQLKDGIPGVKRIEEEVEELEELYAQINQARFQAIAESGIL